MPTQPRTDVSGRPVEMRKLDLDRFFRPKSVAVIGASDTQRRPNTAMWRKIKNWAQQWGADVYPVNPNRETLDGVTCYPTILDIPGDIDLAVILVGAAVEMFETVIEKQPRFAVIFAAGFAEVGKEGEALQERLEKLVAEGDVHLLGPNTNLNAFELFDDDNEGKAVALITQSGHQGRPIFQAQELGLKMSHWAPTGNEADLEFADFAAYFARKRDIGVIAAYIEGFADGRTFMLAADEAARKKTPIVMVKVGRTDEGQSMAKSHTGHLTGSDAVVSAVFRQFGVTRVDGLDELQDTAMLFSRASKPRGNGVCIYAISGGSGAHMADMAADAGLRLPDLKPATQKKLHQWIPEYLRVSNPVDNGGAPSADERGRKILDAIVADPNVDLIICPITGALATLSAPLARDLVDVAQTTNKPICVIWGSPITDDPGYEILVESNLPVFRTYANCVNAVRSYFDYHDFLGRYRSPFEKPAQRRLPAAKQVEGLLAEPGALSEFRSKELLTAYGIPVTRDALATSGAEAAKAAKQIGFPVVMKVSSPDLLHKSDLGLVSVGVASLAEVERTYRDLMTRAEKAAPDARIEGVIVSELVLGGVECVVGVSQDDLFGPTIMFGLGGILVEVLKDVTFRVPPFDRSEARRMIGEVQGFPLLTGARGAPKSKLSALTDVIMKVQRLAMDHADSIAELDINPLVVTPAGAVALDALVVAR